MFACRSCNGSGKTVSIDSGCENCLGTGFTFMGDSNAYAPPCHCTEVFQCGACDGTGFSDQWRWVVVSRWRVREVRPETWIALFFLFVLVVALAAVVLEFLL